METRDQAELQMGIKEKLVFIALFIICLLVYAPVFITLHGYWSRFTEAYAHGYLIVGMIGYLIYLKRDEVFLSNRLDSNRSYLMLLTLALGCSMLWFLAHAVQVQIVEIFAGVLIFWFWLGLSFGVVPALCVAVPSSLIFMAIPLWDGIAIYLRLATVIVVEGLLSLSQVPAYIDGFRIELAYGIVEVAGSCSGLKYFLAGISLAIFYAELNFSSVKRKLVIILLGVVFSIAANWLRVYALVVIAHVSKMQHSLVYDHDKFGWVVFIVCFFVYLGICSKIKSGDVLVSSPRISDKAQASTPVKIKRAVTALVVLSILPVLNIVSARTNENNPFVHRFNFLQALEIKNPSWSIDYKNYDLSAAWKVKSFEFDMELAVYTYLNQQQGKELIYYKNKLQKKNESINNLSDIRLSNNRFINQSSVRGINQERLVAWYYQVGGYKTNRDFVAKLLQIPAQLNGKSTASLVTISHNCKAARCSEYEFKAFESYEFSHLVDAIELKPLILKNDALGLSSNVN